jgi:hypothetical protein
LKPEGALKTRRALAKHVALSLAGKKRTPIGASHSMTGNPRRRFCRHLSAAIKPNWQFGHNLCWRLPSAGRFHRIIIEQICRCGIDDSRRRQQA